jgi:predicted nuclease with TOPRIM domain
MLEKLKGRVEELKKIVEQSISQHNNIVGRLNESQEWLKHLESEALKEKEEIKEVVGEVV